MHPSFSLLALLCLSGCGGRDSAGYEGPYRHLVLISLDTTRADHLSCYGQDGAGAPRVATPRLDRLAQAGTRFADVTAAAPTTLASHTSLMTGTWPHTHGVVRNGFKVNEQNVMLAELLRQQGFHTAGFLGSFALESRFRFDQGFDWFDETFDILVDGSADQNQRLAEDVTAAALAHVDEVKDDAERLFLFLQYFDPHAPYGPPVSQGAPRTDMVQVDAAVRAHQRAITGGQDFGHSDSINHGLVGPRRQLVGAAAGTPLAEDKLLAEAYAGEVAYMDLCLGRFLDGLEARGLLKDTLVVVTADHGETFWEHHDFWNHGLWLYQTTVHVPLIVVLPDGRGAGRSVDTPVSNIDVVPTLCELLGLELPQRNEGVSLVPFLDGKSFDRGAVFSEATQPGPASGVERPGKWGNLYKPRAVRRGPWKYIISPYNKVEQLFHLGDDPQERTDLLAQGAKVGPGRVKLVNELRAELAAWQDSARTLPSSFDRSQYAETVERLKAMGYAGSGDSEGPQDD
jgi:arylsulfatase A-like enzyme